MYRMLSFPRYGAVTRSIAARLAPPLCALAATLLLGAAGPRVPGAWELLESLALLPVMGPLLASIAGLLACHLAWTSALPFSRDAASVLPAALIAAALPGVGAMALLVPLSVSLLALRVRVRAGRLAALLGLGGAATGIAAAWLGSPAAGTAGALTMLAAAALLIRRAARAADNDNRRDEPFVAFGSLPGDPGRAKRIPWTSSPGLGE